MLAPEQYEKSIRSLRDPALSEIHSSTISLHHAKEGYNYPTIRLPHTLSKLAGLPTRIYQIIHEGALAFLVVVGSTNAALQNGTEGPENTTGDANISAFTRQHC